MTRPGFHEDFHRDDHAASSSNRSFGFLVGGAFALIGLSLAWYGKPSGWWLLGMGAGLIATGWLRPDWLAVPNRWWARLGLLLFHVVNPLVMAVLFFLCIVPIGFVMRFLGHDPLRLRREQERPTYWVQREVPSDPSSHNMRNQF